MIDGFDVRTTSTVDWPHARRGDARGSQRSAGHPLSRLERSAADERRAVNARAEEPPLAPLPPKMRATASPKLRRAVSSPSREHGRRRCCGPRTALGAFLAGVLTYTVAAQYSILLQSLLIWPWVRELDGIPARCGMQARRTAPWMNPSDFNMSFNARS